MAVKKLPEGGLVARQEPAQERGVADSCTGLLP
jgi:hypothetical protein